MKTSLSAFEYLQEITLEATGYCPDASKVDAWFARRLDDIVTAECDPSDVLEDGTKVYGHGDLDWAWKQVEALAEQEGR